jgi:hypothetical protein
LVKKFVSIRETYAERVEVFVAEVLGLSVKNDRSILKRKPSPVHD